MPSTSSVRINALLRKKPPAMRDLADGIRALVKKTVPGTKESINPWGIPTFESNGPFAYIMVHAKHITFGFHRGGSLKDPKGLLEGAGKDLRHVKMRSPRDLRRPGLPQLIREAGRLNKKEPMKGMGAPPRRNR